MGTTRMITDAENTEPAASGFFNGGNVGMTNRIEIDLQIRHHFSPGVYAKEMHLPEGGEARSHKHAYDHISMLAVGSAVVDVDGTVTTYHAPAFIMVRAQAEHKITALSDVTWFCVHETDETDVDKIDEVLIGGSHEP